MFLFEFISLKLCSLYFGRLKGFCLLFVGFCFFNVELFDGHTLQVVQLL